MTATATAENSRDSEIVQAPLRYYVDDGIAPTNRPGDELNPVRIYTGTYKTEIMPVKNARAIRDTFDLEKHGFEFIDHKTKVKNFLDPDEMISVYYQETVDIIKACSGATRVHVFIRYDPATKISAPASPYANRSSACITIIPKHRGRSAYAIYCRTKPTSS